MNYSTVCPKCKMERRLKGLFVDWGNGPYAEVKTGNGKGIEVVYDCEICGTDQKLYLTREDLKDGPFAFE